MCAVAGDGRAVARRQAGPRALVATEFSRASPCLTSSAPFSIARALLTSSSRAPRVSSDEDTSAPSYLGARLQ